MEVPMTITSEMKQALEKAGLEPVRVEDPDTKTSYIIMREDVYRRIQDMVRIEQIDPSFFEVGDFVPLKLVSRQ
jgi:hypothetical protein